jgi:biotin operon repressor
VPGEADRVRGVAAALDALAAEMDVGKVEGVHLDDLIGQLRGIRRRTFGPRRHTGSARDRISAVLTARVGEWVTGDELAEAAGISEWARRVRELRASGHLIEESAGRYRLIELPRV